MLNKVTDFISGNLHKDSRSSSPARSPKGLQTIQGASANVQDTEQPHAASSAAPYEQQQPAAATSPGLLPNGAASLADVDDASTAPNTSQDHQQQQQPTDVTATNGTTDSSALNGARSMPPIPPVPPLAPGAMVRSSSAGSSSSRRASLLSDAGRASSRSSLQQQLTESFTEQGEQQQQQQQPARPNISQLPLHLLGRSTEPSVPPSVALQQANSPDHTPQQEQPAPQPFWLSSNWSFGSHCEQNQRVHMEDRFFAADLTGDAAFATAKRAGLFAVFDGHSGHEAAEYLEGHLQTYILAAGPEALAARPLEVLSDAVQRAEREIVASFLEGHGGSETAGSTLCAVLLVDDKLHVVHVGDSRAVLGRGSEPIQLTRDHKPACLIEAARIEVDDPEADISPDGYIYGELAVARAIGSAAWKRDPSKRALIPTPDLLSVQLQPEDDFVLLATDGLWDTLSNGDAVTVTRRSLSRDRSAVTAAKALVARAQGLMATDNITVVALLLHGRGVAMPKSNSMLFNRRALPASFNADADSPPGCSTPCSGASTPASGATPRCCTPNRGVPLTSTASAPAAAVAAAAAAAAAGVSPQRSLPQQLPPTCSNNERLQVMCGLRLTAAGTRAQTAVHTTVKLKDGLQAASCSGAAACAVIVGPLKLSCCIASCCRVWDLEVPAAGSGIDSVF